MTNDSISDFLTRIKNAYLARHKSVELSYVKTLFQIGKILKSEGFIKDLKVATKDGKKTINIELLYVNRKPALFNIVRVSKPGLRVYVGRSRIPYVYGGIGTAIISTSKGFMTGKEARKKGLGGEVICKVW